MRTRQISAPVSFDMFVVGEIPLALRPVFLGIAEHEQVGHAGSAHRLDLIRRALRLTEETRSLLEQLVYAEEEE